MRLNRNAPLDGVPVPPPTPPSPPAAPRRTLRNWHLFLIGVASGLFGLLPWLLTGMRLPLQNLWATETLPDEMPLVLLPFSQYALSLIAALLVIGSAVAGVVARATRSRTPRHGLGLLVFGVLLVDLVAVAQTAVTVAAGLRSDGMARLYLGAVLADAVLAVAVGLGALLLIARAPRAGALLGLTVAAVLSPGWLHLVMAPEWPSFAGEQTWLWAAVRWVPAALVGASIAWAGIGTIGRAIAALASLALLWVAPALITAVSNAAGSRVLARDLGEMLGYGSEVFRAALFEPGLAVPPLIVAVVVAALGLIGRRLLGRARARPRVGDEVSGSPGGEASID